MVTERIQLHYDVQGFSIRRFGGSESLSPHFTSIWDLRGWLVCQGYTPMQAAMLISKTTGPMPEALTADRPVPDPDCLCDFCAGARIVQRQRPS